MLHFYNSLPLAKRFIMYMNPWLNIRTSFLRTTPYRVYSLRVSFNVSLTPCLAAVYLTKRVNLLITSTLLSKDSIIGSKSFKDNVTRKIYFLKKWSIISLFFIYFCLFKQTLQSLQQINVENVHPVYGAGIQTHNLWHMCLIPLPLDQGKIILTWVKYTCLRANVFERRLPAQQNFLNELRKMQF